MRHEHTEMLNGITAYLRVHFPDVAFTSTDDVKTKSVVFHGDGRPRYRLQISERFLNGEDGVIKSLTRLDEWDLAAVLREAKSKLVTLATTGVHISERARWSATAMRR